MGRCPSSLLALCRCRRRAFSLFQRPQRCLCCRLKDLLLLLIEGNRLKELLLLFFRKCTLLFL
jgi:hypothetical protein